MTTNLPSLIAGDPPITKQSKTPKRDEAKRKLAGIPKARIGNVDFDPRINSLWIDGEIGDQTVIDVRSALRQMRGHVKLFLNSPGGFVSAGISIFNELSQYSAGVTTICTGVVASIASVIFQAGEKRLMADGTLVMVHSPWSTTSGNSAELQKQIEVLDKFQTQMVAIYVKRSGKSQAAITKLLESETWFTSDEAIAEGFADS